MNILEDLKQRRIFPSQMEIIICILQVYNCRAGEVLRAEWRNFHPDQFLILPAEKSSASVIIRDRLILNSINNLARLDKVLIFPLVNYMKLYRHCKQRYAHLFVKFKGNQNFKVTHGFRYMAVEHLNDEAYIRDVLFHRSKKSGRFYKIKKKGSSNENKKI
jgi:integrase